MHGARPPLRFRLSSGATALAPALLLLACGSPAPVVPPPAPVAMSAVPEPTVPPSAVVDTPAPPAASSPFRKVGSIDTEATIFARGPGSVFLAVGIDLVAIAEGDAVTLQPTLQQADNFSLRPMCQLTTVRKGTGDNVWAGWIFQEGRVGTTLIERFDGKKWVAGGRSRNGYSIEDMYELGPNRLVAIQAPQMYPEDTPRLIALEGGKAGLPQVSKRPTKVPSDQPSAGNLWFVPGGALPLKGGGTYLFGNPFTVDEKVIVRPMYETFDAKGKSTGRGELDLGVADKSVSVTAFANSLPGGPMVLSVHEGERQAQTSSLRLVRSGADKPDFVRVDGIVGDATGMTSDAQGDVYVLTKGATTGLFHVSKDGKAQAIELPPELQGARTDPLTVMAKSPDDVWLFAPGGGKIDLYRTKANAPKIEATLPNPTEAFWAKQGREAEAREAKAAQRALVFARMFSSKCATPFVLLYTLAKTAPKDYDFPATRDALKGHTELAQASFIEFSRGGKRYFGAVVPSGDLGKKLVEAVKGKVPGSTPQLVCDAPAPDRTIAIDLATGKIKP